MTEQKVVMSEIAKVISRDRNSLIKLLQNSGSNISANSGDQKIIDAIVVNGNNYDFQKGLAILLAKYNSNKVSADGESNNEKTGMFINGATSALSSIANVFSVFSATKGVLANASATVETSRNNLSAIQDSNRTALQLALIKEQGKGTLNKTTVIIGVIGAALLLTIIIIIVKKH